jgi:hypothetical protein
MVPSLVAEPFTGPAAEASSNVDHSIFVGSRLAAIPYLALSRTVDLGNERRIAFAEGLVKAVRR